MKSRGLSWIADSQIVPRYERYLLRTYVVRFSLAFCLVARHQVFITADENPSEEACPIAALIGGQNLEIIVRTFAECSFL